MKTKNIFFPAFLLLVATASAFSATPKKHKYTFNLKGLHDAKCYMGYYYGDKSYLLDSTNADAKGNFHFEGDSVMPDGVYFVLLKSKVYFEFLIDKQQQFTMRSDTADIVKNMKVEGSPENQLFYDYLNFSSSNYGKLQKIQDSAKTPEQKTVAQHKVDSLNTLVKKYKEDFMVKHSDFFLAELFKAAEYPDVPETPTLPNGRKDSTFNFRYYKSHFFDNINFSDDRMVHTPPQVFFNRIKEYLSRLTFQIPDSVNAAADYIISKARKSPDMFKFLVNYIAYTYETSDIMGMDAVFVHMVETYYTPQIATWETASHLAKMQERAAQLAPIILGKKAPTIVLPDTANVMTAMDSVKANYTLVCFWDYDCSACQKEIPKLIQWYDSIKGEGIQVYAVLTHEDPDMGKWKGYIKEHKLDWINVGDLFHTGTYHHDYDVISTPMIYVLDENKKIIAKKIDKKDLNPILKNDKKTRSEKSKD